MLERVETLADEKPQDKTAKFPYGK